MANDFFQVHAGVPEALEKYFGLDLTDAVDRAKVPGIRGKYKQIQAGIAGAFDIVVGHVHDGDDIKDGLRAAFKSLKGGHLEDAWHDIKDIRTDTGGWVANRGGVQGRIHLNVDRIENFSEGKIARIIVHEASHKFAQTKDVRLLNDGTYSSSPAYKWNKLKYNKKDFADLDNNADSYAWAARLMWKRKRGLQSGV